MKLQKTIKRKRRRKSERWGWFKKLDDLLRVIVKERDKICQRCGKDYDLQDAHIFSRRCLSTRWNTANHILLCKRCHIFWAHPNGPAFTLWIVDKIGMDELRALETNSTMVVHWKNPELENIYNGLIDMFKM